MTGTTVVLAAELFVGVICVVLGLAVTTHRLRFACPLALGIGLIVLAVFGALDALLSDRPFLDVESIAWRWLFFAGGAALILGLIGWRLLHPRGRDHHRRITDYVTTTGGAETLGSPLRRSFDGPPDVAAPRRRRLWSWRGRQ